MKNSVRIRRSLLFIPGSKPRMLEKTTHVGADSVILDLEDGVAFEDKDQARQLVKDAIKNIMASGIEVIVRINPFYTQWGDADIREVAGQNPDAIMIPKATDNQMENGQPISWTTLNAEMILPGIRLK